MRKLSKLMILIISLLGLAQCIWFIGLVVPIDYLSRSVLETVQTSNTWILAAAFSLSGLLGLACLTGILLAGLAPKKVKQVTFNSPNGKLSISQQAVEKMIQEKVRSHKGIADVKAKLKITGRKPKASVRISAVDHKKQDLVSLGEEIQEMVIHEVDRIMAIPVKRVKVHLKPIDSLKDRRARQPRVV